MLYMYEQNTCTCKVLGTIKFRIYILWKVKEIIQVVD